MGRTPYDSIITESILSYLLDTVWNEPYSEYRQNIKFLLLTTQSSVKGNFTNPCGLQIPLPNRDDTFYVFGLSNPDMCIDINMPTDSWISTDTILHQYRTYLHLYTIQGSMCSLKQVYIRYTSDKQFIYIAVPKKHLLKIEPTFSISKCINNPRYTTNINWEIMSSLDICGLFMTVYFDSDLDKPIRCYSTLITPTNIDTYIYDLQQFLTGVDTDKLLIYLNGKYHEFPIQTSIQIGDYLDIVYDENILFTYTCSLKHPPYSKIYRSSRDATDKYVIHIPKALNPDSKVVSHNTCEFYVIGNTCKYGKYVHRCADISIENLTHQDYSIPRYIVDAYRDYLKDLDVQIKVVVRQHDKDNVLLPDYDYIYLLYTHSDEDIHKFLVGEYSRQYPQLDFWTGNSLENSFYVKYYFNVPDHQIDLRGYMKEYIQALGYYHVLNLISQHVYKHTVTDPNYRDIEIVKPYLYRHVATSVPIVYKNGTKILNDYVGVLYEDDTKLTVRILDNVPLAEGDTITIILSFSYPYRPFVVQVTDTNYSFSIQYTDVDVYEVQNTYTKYTSFNKTSQILYSRVDPDKGYYIVDTIDGKPHILFSEYCYGSTYLIYPKQFSMYSSVYIDPIISQGSNIIIDLEVRDINNTIVPIMDTQAVSVYLNSKYLVRNVDYSVIEVGNTTGISFKQLVISNLEYLEEEGNIVEIYVHTNYDEDSSYGCIRKSKIFDSSPIMLFYPNLTVSHIEGKLVDDIIFKGTHCEVPSQYRDGLLYEIKTTVPSIVTEYLAYHYPEAHERAIQRLDILNSYFYPVVEKTIEQPIIVPENHRLYSVFLNYLIRLVIFEGYKFVDDPDIYRKVHQLDKYLFLQKYDPTYQLDKDILDYIDIYPAYRHYTGTPEQYSIVRIILDIYKNQDKVVSGADYWN